MESCTAHENAMSEVAPLPVAAAQRKAIVVHGGARDGYQLARALSEAGMLESLVTDLYWKGEGAELDSLRSMLPQSMLSVLRRRSAPELPNEQVSMHPIAGIGGLLLDRIPAVPVAAKRILSRASDSALGRAAGKAAKLQNAALLSYSYFGYDAFKEYGPGGLLFQVHPHPVSMRKILREELQRFPDSAKSLNREWEMALPESDFQHLVEEVSMASGYLAASSFTRATLVENGIREEAIHVVPYGVDSSRFTPDRKKAHGRTNRLRLLFVGRINQRKGIRYLLQALDRLPSQDIELLVLGRIADDHHIFERYRTRVEVRTNVSFSDLLRAYQAADLFVFPSVGEGFGHVLLEAMACGLPVLTTTHTAGPDLIDEGVQGFVVEPRSPELLAEKIDWAVRNRSRLEEMGETARRRAQQFTWERFRFRAANAVGELLQESATGIDQEPC